MLHDEHGPRAAFVKPVWQQGRQVSQTDILGSCFKNTTRALENKETFRE